MDQTILFLHRSWCYGGRRIYGKPMTQATSRLVPHWILFYEYILHNRHYYLGSRKLVYRSCWWQSVWLYIVINNSHVLNHRDVSSSTCCKSRNHYKKRFSSNMSWYVSSASCLCSLGCNGGSINSLYDQLPSLIGRLYSSIDRYHRHWYRWSNWQCCCHEAFIWDSINCRSIRYSLRYLHSIIFTRKELQVSHVLDSYNSSWISDNF